MSEPKEEAEALEWLQKTAIERGGYARIWINCGVPFDIDLVDVASEGWATKNVAKGKGDSLRAAVQNVMEALGQETLGKALKELREKNG